VSAVEIALESAPPGADVFEQGGDKLLGRTPIKLSFEGRGDQVRLRLTKAGYQPLEKTVSLDRDQRLAVELRALPAAPARRERSGAVGPPSRRKRAPAGERQAPLDPGATIDPFESD